MAISLNSLATPRNDRPIICTILAEAGMGKTSLAASFPQPVIIRVEDGTSVLRGREDVYETPRLTTYKEVLDWIEALATQEHDFKTVVLDSITQLNTIIEAEIVASDDKAQSLNQALGGYGAGYTATAERHRTIREWMGALAEQRGMNVVFIAHATTEEVKPADSDPYIRYTLNMHHKSVKHYNDNVDLVGYIKLKTLLSGSGDVKRATTTGERELICHATPNNISKNRMGIKKALPFVEGENPLAPYLQNATADSAAPQPAQQAA